VNVHMVKDRLSVEQRPEGDYAVRRPHSGRASAVQPTQAEATEKTRELDRNVAPLVERVRHTSAGRPDKWRKP
jgi:pyridoxine/pyridoxamine 5'-phosphate oxidase